MIIIIIIIIIVGQCIGILTYPISHPRAKEHAKNTSATSRYFRADNKGNGI